MSVRTNVSPATIGVDMTEDGIYLQYLDARRVFYRGTPERVEGSVTTPPGKDVHVLVTDPAATEGVMVYVNDLKTHDDILESSGVGRVVLDAGETNELFPGVSVAMKGHSVAVVADITLVQGRVFVFVEDEMSEHSYELV